MRRAIALVFLAMWFLTCTALAQEQAGAAATELLQNPGFEAGKPPWAQAPPHAFFSIDSTTAHSGTASALITEPASPGQVAIHQDVVISAGLGYMLTGWLLWNDPDVDQVGLRLEWRDLATGAPVGSAIEAFAVQRGPGWQQLTIGPVAAPAGASIANVRCSAFITNANPSNPPHFDDLSLTETALPRPDLVSLNELLPAPHSQFTSEYVELYNAGRTRINLLNWRVEDAYGHSFPLCAQGIDPGEFLLCEQNFSLNNDGDTVTLLDDLGSVIDAFAYGQTSYDRSWSRSVDGAGTWTLDYPPTPGESNISWRVWRFWGTVYEGLPGDTTRPLAGSRVDLFGLHAESGYGQLLRTQTTGIDGWYGLTTDSEYPYYMLAEHDPPGYVSTGATSSGGGDVLDQNTILFAHPPPGQYYLDNLFWDARPEDIPTSTPTPTPTPTRAPVHPGAILLNEVAADTAHAGFESGYEWLELLNVGAYPLDLAHWQIADNHGIDLLPDYVLQPGDLVIVAASTDGFLEDHPSYLGPILILPDGRIGNGLANDGDRLSLMGPEGELIDAISYGDDDSLLSPPVGAVAPGYTMCRQPSGWDTDTANDWADCATPSPGEHNPPPEPTASPTVTTAPPTPTLTPTSTATTAPPTATTAPPTATTAPPTATLGPPTPTATSAQPTSAPPTPTSTPVPAGVVINEFLPAPGDIDWDEDGSADPDDEWIELYNGSGASVDISGWMLDDMNDVGAMSAEGSKPYRIPDGTVLSAQAFMVFFYGQTKVRLNNDGDDVRLLAPNSQLVDSVTYTNTRRDGSWSRTVDGAGRWTEYYPPSPGGPNLPATPTSTPTSAPPTATLGTPTPTATSAQPTSAFTPLSTTTPTPTATPTATPYPLGLVINEFLPAPREIDWDGDGLSDLNDEWIELYNSSDQAINLGGYLLDDEADEDIASAQSSSPYAIPDGVVIDPRGFRLFFRDETGLALNNYGDTARLLGPDSVILDSKSYAAYPGADISWSRAGDGADRWTTSYPPSPGRSNLPPPPTPTKSAPTPEAPKPPNQVRPGINEPLRCSIETAKEKYLGTWVMLEGQVTVPPPFFGSSIYIQDHTGGIRVTLYYREEFPGLGEGDWLRVTGLTSQDHGESRIWVNRAADLRRMGPGVPIKPQVVTTGEIDEQHEGLLVQVLAPVTDFKGSSIYINDGSGEARVYVRESTGFERPWVEEGEYWSVVGIASQYSARSPFEGGYRLLPRYASDLSTGPLFLPQTGAGATRTTFGQRSVALGEGATAGGVETDWP